MNLLSCANSHGLIWLYNSICYGSHLLRRAISLFRFEVTCTRRIRVQLTERILSEFLYVVSPRSRLRNTNCETFTHRPTTSHLGNVHRTRNDNRLANIPFKGMSRHSTETITLPTRSSPSFFADKKNVKGNNMKNSGNIYCIALYSHSSTRLKTF